MHISPARLLPAAVLLALCGVSASAQDRDQAFADGDLAVLHAKRAEAPPPDASPPPAAAPADVAPPDEPTADVAGAVGRAEALPPARARFEMHLGQRLLAQGLDERAAESFRRVTESAPQHPGGWYLLSRAQMGTGAKAEALASAEEAVRRLEAVPPAAREGFDEAAFYENLGVARGDVGDLQGAEEPLRHAVALRPDRGVLHARLGAVLLSRGEDEEAAAELRRATEQRPDLPRAWRALGQALVRLERSDEALAALAHADALAPGDPETAFQQAEAHRVAGDETAFEASLAEFESRRAARKERDRETDEIDTQLREVVSLLSSGDCAKAEPMLRELLARPPVAAEGHQATRILADLARCRKAAGDLDEAQRLLERARVRRPESFLINFELGSLLAQRGQVVQAVPLLVEAARANPFDYAVHVNLGLCFGLLGRLNEALGELRRAAALQPEEPRARQLLVNLEWAVGNSAQAEALVRLGGVEPAPGMPGAPGGPTDEPAGWAP